ncbi:hypothetical protein SERLA73DRAFT_148786 [Serpula lacrymans var. lacrymans S7.3]|uniref:Uncharacterized protein n=1 Tax=Serpula lacrymans var. lacrymans (strain S7.3) TaxID=936435 RepID=F8PEU3_SERL3|nr:hypothetical protein SERLA73DRAFT_148786 [Serpula lacrymans var. lacrymans S7.3]
MQQTPTTNIGPPQIQIPARKVALGGKEREKELERIAPKPKYRKVEVVITKRRYPQNVGSPSKEQGKTKVETPSKDTTTPNKTSRPILYVIPCAECLNNVKKEGPFCCVKEVDNLRGTSCIPCQRKWAQCYWSLLETQKALLKQQLTEDLWAPSPKEEIKRMELQELLASRVKCAEVSLVVAETFCD